MIRTRFRHVLMVMAAVGVLGALTLAQGQGGADQSLQAARTKAAVEGKLDEAIKLYADVVAKFKADRPTVVRALIEMADCYGKLGQTKSRELYEQIVREYPDQKEAAAEARTRLAAFGEGSQAGSRTGPITRTIGTRANSPINDGKTESGFWGSPSPDGRYLVGYRAASPREIFIMDAATGETRTLVTFKSSETSYATPRFSPDGRQIAYEWDSGRVKEIRVIGADGIGARTVLKLAEDVFLCQLWAWSTDGRYVVLDWNATKKSDAGGGGDLETTVTRLAVADGAVTRLTTLDLGQVVIGGSLSPDGRYLVLATSDKGGTRGLSLIPVAGDGQRAALTPLVPPAKGDGEPAWTPDGSGVVFLSERTGPTGLWFVRVANGRAVGRPELLKADLGSAETIGLSRSGTFFYSVHTGRPGVFAATLDPSTGKMIGSVTEFDGSSLPKMAATGLSWSPDGQQFAYNTAREVPGGAPEATLTIHSLATGKDRTIPIQTGMMNGPPHWNSDGRSILLRAQVPADVSPDLGRLGGSGLYSVDAVSGVVTRVFSKGASGFGRGRFATPVGLGFYALNSQGAGTDATSRVVFRDFESGEAVDRVVISSPLSIGGFTLSADGTRLALMVTNSTAGTMALQIMPAQGGERRTLVTLQGQDRLDASSLTWTGDGRAVLGIRFGGQKDGERRELWRFPVDGGEPTPTGLAMDNIAGTRAQPLGTQVLFTAGRFTYEIRALENFLPKPAAPADAKGKQR